MYILRQLLFSISVNSGFRNIYLATSWIGINISNYSSRFQRIVINYFQDALPKFILMIFLFSFDIFAIYEINYLYKTKCAPDHPAI